ncbi:DNA polymerase III subunit beta [Methylobacterium sp. Leaf102]|uniref:DNA polymerase III subunit beta n=1 Tax=Methylobacterium sp. Leaf102 TaxID=1736253 RepID=UPI0006FF90BA|nr:DNA polymerase III subunit beta [Methylobacterium sp. Leaf102]KQP34284.1 DNA polymerase III subunit beta [Methylobacterium sp. Leaf102]
MRLTCERSGLFKALNAATRTVERRNTIPILSNVCFAAEGKRLTIRATDLDIEIQMECAATVEEAGGVTVPAHTLKEIVRKLADDKPISMKTTDKGQIVVQSGRSRFELGTLPVGDFPDLQAGEMPSRFTWPVADVLRMFEQTSFAISTEETRYYLNGVYLHAPDGLERHEGLRAVATDGHRLARLALPRPEGAEGMPGVIIPRKTVAELGHLVEIEGSAQFEVAVSPTKIRFTRDDVVLTSKLIDGTFPDYARVIPTGNDKRLTVAREALAGAVDRVSTVSSERGRAVRLDIDAGVIRLSQRNPDAGEATDEVNSSLDGAPLQIGFNGKYLSEALAVLGGEQIVFQLADPGSPTILTRTGDDALLVVLMPMRV